MIDKQADQLLATLKAAYPHADTNIDPLQARARDALYRSFLLKWSPEAAGDAVRVCILGSRFYPTVAELHDAYSAAARAKPERVALPPAGGTQASPAEVKAACAEAMRRVEHMSVGRDAPRRKAEVADTSEPLIPPAPAASPDDEQAMILETIRRTGRG